MCDTSNEPPGLTDHKSEENSENRHDGKQKTCFFKRVFKSSSLPMRSNFNILKICHKICDQ